MLMHSGAFKLARNHAIKAICFITFLATSTVCFSSQIYKWTDKRGIVHYGDHIPAQYKNKEEHIKNDSMSVVNYDKSAAAAAARVKKDNHKPVNMKKASKNGHKLVLNNTKTKSTRNMSCAARWAAYNSSVACYNKCSTHTVYHGKNIAKCHCTTVVMPDCQVQ